MSDAAPSVPNINNIHIVLIHGKAGSGKDWFADQLLSSCNNGYYGEAVGVFQQIQDKVDLGFMSNKIHRAGLADCLKASLFAQGDILPEEVVANRKTKELRYKLINTATSVRQQHGNDYYVRFLWAQILLAAMRNHRVTFIVPDLREEHELEFFKTRLPSENLHLFHIHAPERVRISLEKQTAGDAVAKVVQSSHSSEVGLDALTKDRVTAEDNGFIWVDNNIPSQNSV